MPEQIQFSRSTRLARWGNCVQVGATWKKVFLGASHYRTKVTEAHFWWERPSLLMIRWKPLRCAAFVTACLDDNGCSVTLINETPFPYSAICTQALALWLAHSHMAGEKLLSPTKGLKMDQLHSSRTLFPRREREREGGRWMQWRKRYMRIQDFIHIVVNGLPELFPFCGSLFLLGNRLVILSPGHSGNVLALSSLL